MTNTVHLKRAWYVLVDQVYDANSRMTLIRNPSGERTTLQWDGLDREVKRTFGNGMTTSHVYDAAGNETGLWTADKDGVTLARYTATYNRTGYLLTNRELDGRRVTYLYDLGYRLGGEQWSGPAGISDWVYTYDAAGNRARRTLDGQDTLFTYDAASRLTKLTAPGSQVTTLAYDGNGNLAWEEGMTGARTTYTWDPENRLSSVTLPSGSVQTNTYLRDGRRLRRTTDGVVKIYNWDALNVLLELDTSLAVQAEYTDYPGIWGGLASMRRGATSSYYGFDFQGATRILVSTGGIVTDSATYNAWGEGVAQSGSTENPYGYGGEVGYQSGEAAGLQYLRQRYYDPQAARFISRDPVGFLDEPNLYTYCQADPVNWVDPFGLAAKNIESVYRRQAFIRAKIQAGVPRSQQAYMQYEMGPDASRKGGTNYVYSRARTRWGRYWAYNTPKGPRLIVEHTGEPELGPHFHATGPQKEKFKVRAAPPDYDFRGTKYNPIEVSADDPKQTHHHLPYKLYNSSARGVSARARAGGGPSGPEECAGIVERVSGKLGRGVRCLWWLDIIRCFIEADPGFQERRRRNWDKWRDYWVDAHGRKHYPDGSIDWGL